MTTVLVRVNRKAAIQRGINGTDTPVAVDLDVAKMSQEDRDDVADRILIDDAGTARLRIRYAGDDQGYTPGDVHSAILTVVIPDQPGVLEAIAEERAAVAAEIAKREPLRRAREAQQAALIQTASEMVIRDPVNAVYPIRSGGPLSTGCYGDGNTHSVCVDGDRYVSFGELTDAAQAAANEYAASVRAEIERRKAAAAERKAAAVREAARDRADWIAAHGSHRLRTLAVEGIGHENTYRAERAAWEQAEFDAALSADWPTWTEIDEEDIVRNVDDAPESALAILDAARQTIRSATLARVGGKYVAVAEYRGRWIYWPRG